MSSLQTNIRIFWALLCRDMHILRSMLFDNVIDSTIIVAIVYFIYGNLLPLLGMSTALLLPTFVGTVVIVLMNVAYDRAIIDSLDFEFTKFIDYQRTLPLSINWLLAKYVISYVIDLCASSLPILLIGRLFIGSQLTIINPLIFAVAYILGMFFMSLLVLTLAIAKDFKWFRENTWPRVLLPMTTLGGLYFPIKSLVVMLPWTKWLMGIIPMSYLVEGLRHGIGAEAYIPAKYCVMALLVLNGILIMLLKHAVHKRIDPL